MWWSRSKEKTKKDEIALAAKFLGGPIDFSHAGKHLPQ
jgi:hypothetical protein